MFKFLSIFRPGLLIPSLILLAISTIMFFGGEFWPWGWAAGAVLFAFSFKSSSEKKGYRS